MTTLADLNRDASNSNEQMDAYMAARRAKVREIAEYLGDKLRSDVDAAATAEEVMSSAEEMGRIDGDEINGEVRGIYTLDGKPLPLTL